jgi:hypothetical protein
MNEKACKNCTYYSEDKQTITCSIDNRKTYRYNVCERFSVVKEIKEMFLEYQIGGITRYVDSNTNRNMVVEVKDASNVILSRCHICDLTQFCSGENDERFFKCSEKYRSDGKNIYYKEI